MPSSTSYGSIPQIPSFADAGSPRTGSPFLTPQGRPSVGQRTASGEVSLASSAAPSRSETPLTEAQKAEIVRRHLLSAEDQQRIAAEESSVNLPSSAASVTSNTTEQEPRTGLDEQYPTPYHLEGGDVVAGVYKWAAQASSTAPSMRRVKSFDELESTIALGGAGSRRTSMNPGTERPDMSALAPSATGEALDDEEDPNGSGMRVREILEPGGFRRDFVNRKRSDADLPSLPTGGASFGNGNGSSRGTRSFIDFLSLYGHFGGEDLEEIDEEDEDEDDEEDEDLTIPPFSASGQSTSRGVNERTPLVRGRSERRGGEVGTRKRSSSVGQHGDATVTQAVLMLLKSFVGTGVLFLGKA